MYISPQSTDDSNFIKNINLILQDRIDLWKPKELYLTRINNWFDQKWYLFAGTAMHEIAFWKEEPIIVPPFHPNRVESSEFYQYQEGSYLQQELSTPLHIIQPSINNLKRKINSFSNDGLFIWYTSQSEKNGNGALLCYCIREDTCRSFYVSFNKNKLWQPSIVKGLPFSEIQRIIDKNIHSSSVKHNNI